jgi:hypothetical protein
VNKFALSHALARNFSALVLALWFGLSWSAGHAQETCERTGIEFGFFNGVKTQERSALDVVEEFLPLLYGHTTPDGQPISYTLYYNDTDPWLTDFVETFDQRLQEHGGLLSQRFELFFSALQGGGDWWSRITGSVSTLRGVLDGIHDASQAAIARAATAAFGNPGSFEVSQRHREQIDHALAMDKGLLLFAHSQGNLFVNQAYHHARSQVGAESVRVVHVAPASPLANGPHVLANLDVVINALRVVGFVLPNTDVIPLPMERIQQRDLTLSDEWDVAGHGLLPTY